MPFQVPTFAIGITQDAKTPSFQIDSIDFEGCERLDPLIQGRIKDNYLDKKLSINDINNLVRDLTNEYIDRGYVTTRVYIPKQNLKEGTLKLSVVEGYIEDIVYLGPQSQIDMAFGAIKGRVLNMRDVEQGLDQMNRLQSNRVTTKFIPSESKLGATVIFVSNEYNPKGAAKLRYDTFSDPILQSLPNSLDLSLDNLINLSERWGLNYSQRFKSKDQVNNSLMVNLSVPYQYLTWNTSYSQFDYLMILQGYNRLFTTSGKTTTIRSELSASLFRNQTAKTQAAMGLSIKETDSFIEDVKSDTGSRKLALLELGMNHTYYSGLGTWYLSGSYVQGMGRLGATLTNPASETEPQAQYRLVQADLNWSNRIMFDFCPMTLQSRWHGQFCRTTLFSSERITIGDFSSVRGYEAAVQGDSGVYIVNEVSYRLTDMLPAFAILDFLNPVSMFEALDAGYIRQHGGVEVNGPEGEARLIGAAIGLRYTIPGLSADLTYSRPLKASAYIQKPEYVVYFSLTKDIF